MKQCPLCNEHCADEQNFCDADGSLLVENLRKRPNAEVLPPAANHGRASQVWPTVTIGILIGIIICLTAYAVVMTPPSDRDGRNNRSESARVNPSDRSLPATTTRAEPLPAASIPETSPEEAAAETASPAPVAEVPQA